MGITHLTRNVNKKAANCPKIYVKSILIPYLAL